MTYLKLFATLSLLHLLVKTEGFSFRDERVCPDPDLQPGKCTTGKECSVTPTSTTIDACFNEILSADASCKFFDFDSDANKCLFHTECVPDTSCATCNWASRDCTPAPDPGTKCGVVGTWKGCTTQTASTSSSYADCLQQCTDAGDKCTHFTFFPGTFSRDGIMERKAACFKYTGCANFEEKGCTNCISGQSECGALECGIDRCCKGDQVGSLFGVTAEQCLEYCNTNVSDCKWYSYYKELEGCILTNAEECDDDGEPEGTCNSGQKGCPSIGTPTCNEDSCCSDTTLAASLVTSEEACLKKCSGTVQPVACKWYTFVKEVRFCLLFSSICREKIDVGAGLCSSGEYRCPTGSTTTTASTTTSIGPETSTTTIVTTTTTATTTTKTTTTTIASICWKTGQVQGDKLSASKTPTREECLQKCRADSNCVYLTYYSTTVCSLFKTFDQIIQGCTNCFSRDPKCEE